MVHSACLVTPGSEEYGECSQRFLRELGRPCRFHRARRLEIPPTNSRLIHGSASGAGGDEQRTQRWYRQAQETKRGEMGGRESQHLRVPWKRGNQPEGPRQGNFLTLSNCRFVVSEAHQRGGRHQVVEPMLMVAFAVESMNGTVVGAGLVAPRGIGAKVQQ